MGFVNSRSLLTRPSGPQAGAARPVAGASAPGGMVRTNAPAPLGPDRARLFLGVPVPPPRLGESRRARIAPGEEHERRRRRPAPLRRRPLRRRTCLHHPLRPRKRAPVARPPVPASRGEVRGGVQDEGWANGSPAAGPDRYLLPFLPYISCRSGPSGIALPDNPRGRAVTNLVPGQTPHAAPPVSRGERLDFPVVGSRRRPARIGQWAVGMPSRTTAPPACVTAPTSGSSRWPLQASRPRGAGRRRR